MKNLALLTFATIGFVATPAFANANTVGQKEDVRLTLDLKKFDTSISATERFEKLKRVAERTCDSSARSLEAKKFEKACALEVKRSVLSKMGDEALKAQARSNGVPLN